MPGIPLSASGRGEGEGSHTPGIPSPLRGEGEGEGSPNITKLPRPPQSMPGANRHSSNCAIPPRPAATDMTWIAPFGTPSAAKCRRNRLGPRKPQGNRLLLRTRIGRG